MISISLDYSKIKLIELIGLIKDNPELTDYLLKIVKTRVKIDSFIHQEPFASPNQSGEQTDSPQESIPLIKSSVQKFQCQYCNKDYKYTEANRNNHKNKCKKIPQEIKDNRTNKDWYEVVSAIECDLCGVVVKGNIEEHYAEKHPE